ncbi:MAG: RodZ domain-containing protein [Vulcanimicrobiaceae bacterium]|jgi:cytoskeletal protein RodZ
MPSLGDEFRVAREARGLSLSDVAENLHIRSTYLQAIEEEDWAVIGAPVYIRGFIRTYARFLGVDPEHAIEGFNATVPSAPPTKQWNGGGAVSVDPGSGGGPSLWVWVAGVIALALVGYVGYGYYQLHSGAAPEKTAAAIPIAPNSATPASSLPPASATPLAAIPAPLHPGRPEVSIKLTQLSWMRVIVDGNVVIEGEYPPGTTRDFKGKHVKLLVGNAGGVEVTAPGQRPHVLGSVGQVVERDYTLTGKTE